MAKRLSVVLAAVALVLTLVPSVSAAPGRDPFAGLWKATDYDGSSMTLAISGGGAHRILVYYDNGCSSCTPQGIPVYGVGPGSVSGPNLDAVFHLFAGPGATAPSKYEQLFIAHDGTLVAPCGSSCDPSLPDLVWHRAGL